MRAGALRERVIVQQASDSQDAIGTVTRTWTTFATVWAEIRPIRGGEGLAGDQVVADMTHTIRIRYLAGLTPKMRILYGARVFEIQFAANLYERDREMELSCKEVLT